MVELIDLIYLVVLSQLCAACAAIWAPWGVSPCQAIIWAVRDAGPSSHPFAVQDADREKLAADKSVHEAFEAEMKDVSLSEAADGITSEYVSLPSSAGSFVAHSDDEEDELTYNMPDDEKVEYGAARKEEGTALFSAGHIRMAFERYENVIDLFRYIDDFREEQKKKVKDSKNICQLNKAA